MKRAAFLAFWVISLCSLFLPSVYAAYPDYAHTVYPLQNTVTVDGKWTATNEWVDGMITNFNTTAAFVSKWGPLVDMETVPQHYLIEILDDTTNDPGDYWQLCFDGDMSGGNAPQSGDIRIEIEGTLPQHITLELEPVGL